MAWPFLLSVAEECSFVERGVFLLVGERYCLMIFHKSRPDPIIGINTSKARSEGGRAFWTEIVSVVSGIIRSYDYTFFPGRCLECFFFGFVFLAGGVWGNRFT